MNAVGYIHSLPISMFILKLELLHQTVEKGSSTVWLFSFPIEKLTYVFHFTLWVIASVKSIDP